MWHDLLVALSLMMVLEGVLPFLSPKTMRGLVQRVAEMDDRSLRIGGFFTMLLGVGMLYWVN